jgi:CheY-like chemotaxis protein
MKILIVDDSRFVRQMNERALGKAGHQVIAAVDGDEGLRLAREHKPDLIVLDIAAKASRTGRTAGTAKRHRNCCDPGNGFDQPAAIQRRKAGERRSNLVLREIRIDAG